MPGKVNPVMCEVINQISFQVIGNDHTISLASEAGQLELNVMEPVLVFNLLQSFSILQNGMDVFRKYAIEGITANIEHCREMVEKSVGIITAINPHVGYEVASRLFFVFVVGVTAWILITKRVRTLFHLSHF